VGGITVSWHLLRYLDFASTHVQLCSTWTNSLGLLQDIITHASQKGPQILAYKKPRFYCEEWDEKELLLHWLPERPRGSTEYPRGSGMLGWHVIIQGIVTTWKTSNQTNKTKKVLVKFRNVDQSCSSTPSSSFVMSKTYLASHSSQFTHSYK